MRSYVAAGAAVALSISGVNADLCSFGSELIGGNWYCQAVNAITYQNFGSSGSYNRVTDMDSTSGACSSTPQGYSGSLAPLDGEVSMHFRGPIQLKQFAAYVPSSNKKRSAHEAHHGHAHFHERQHEVREIQNEAEKRQEITAVINGQTVSWNQGAPAATGAADWITAVINGKTVSWANGQSVPTEVAAPIGGAVNAALGGAKEKAPYKPAAPPAAGDWVQSAYYNATSGTAKGLTFLNNMGGQGSGTFDYTFGNSLSYASADGQSGSASPQVLADATLPSNNEVIIMSDKPCDGDSCGYYRPDTVAYHGFGGRHKLFVMEFAMPDDGTTGWNMNMPAVWMLNAQIPRTLQYGAADCSCWESGCGEFDLFEVLTSGDTRCKSTIHGNISGGDSDYFNRPTGSPIKAAVLMSESQAHIKILHPSFDFASSVTPAFINELAKSTDEQTSGISLFQLG